MDGEDLVQEIQDGRDKAETAETISELHGRIGNIDRKYNGEVEGLRQEIRNMVTAHNRVVDRLDGIDARLDGMAIRETGDFVDWDRPSWWRRLVGHVSRWLKKVRRKG